MNAVASPTSGAEPFSGFAGLTCMDLTRIAALFLAFTCAGARAADFELTADEARRVNQGEIVIRADLDPGQRRGTVRAAMRVEAPPHVIFAAMSRCADAMEYVPHLRSCRLQAQPGHPDAPLVEHEIDLGWFAPRMRYVFRAELVADRSISFRQVSGDFKVNEGRWELEADADGQGTLLRYRVRIDPPGYVPNWLARSTFRKELPRMLENLKRHCETGTPVPAQASNLP
jgi:ribosome-associated toxin RatA of RatAB toxin-antitoxin module